MLTSNGVKLKRITTMVNEKLYCCPRVDHKLLHSRQTGTYNWTPKIIAMFMNILLSLALLLKNIYARQLPSIKKEV